MAHVERGTSPCFGSGAAVGGTDAGSAGCYRVVRRRLGGASAMATMAAQTNRTSVMVRQMRAEDWELARCVRLAALADAPQAFARTLDEEVALPDQTWRERARASAAGETRVGFLALCDEVPCGLVVGVLASPREAELQGMWVAPNVRRRGVGRALTHAVCAWARQRGARHISLEVVSVSEPALALYRANGFEPSSAPDAMEAVDAAYATCGARRAPALRLSKTLWS